MTTDILDELFHGCAFAAFITEARAAGTWPDPEKTRQRAYQLYEEELARKGEEPKPSTRHDSHASALATPAEHFAIVGSVVHAFTGEDDCWRFIHAQRGPFGRDPDSALYPRYASRRELARKGE